MEIKNVAAFVKIVEYNSFTKAAGSLGYSQAAVTARIKALEQELDTPLFDRVGKRVFLTQAGRTFLPYALELLQAEEAALHSVQPAAELTGELRICSASSFAAEVLPDLLLRYLRLHPRVKISARTSDYPEDTMLMLARGEIDFWCDVGREYTSPDFRAAGQRREPMVFVTWPGNPLLQKKNIGVADVIRDQFIMSDLDYTGYSLQLEEQLQRRGLSVEPALVLGSAVGIVNVIRGGFGTSFIPRYAAARYLDSGELAELSVRDMDIEVYTYFLYSRHRWLNPAMREFIRVVDERAGA
ncbi:MAG: LysR family transcriptional regulator [Firmicutes bacterium]|nr:LysR family transcriptional regulator [Bacillota bacterium]